MYICIYVYMYICIYYICVCVYIYIYIYIYIKKPATSHVASHLLYKWLSVHFLTKWFWVRILLLSLKIVYNLEVLKHFLPWDIF